MPAHVVLTLDTTAPVVSWGEPSGSTAGEIFSIPYSLNEGRVVTAEIEDAAGQVTPLVVGAEVLTATLPEGTAEGQATVRAAVEDEVLNSATRTTTTTLTGQVATPSSPLLTSGAIRPQRRPIRPRPRLIESVSRLGFTLGYEAGADLEWLSRVDLRSGWHQEMRASGSTVLMLSSRDRSVHRAVVGQRLILRGSTRIARKPHSGEDARWAAVSSPLDDEILLLFL